MTRKNTDNFQEIRENPCHPCLKENRWDVSGQEGVPKVNETQKTQSFLKCLE